jgi:hypothetical protein
MGQGLSCRGSHEHGLFRAVQHGDLQTVSTLLKIHPSLIHRTTVYDHHSPLHIAAANGQIQVQTFSLLLQLGFSFSFLVLKKIVFFIFKIGVNLTGFI